jgi:hypothetical protein
MRRGGEGSGQGGAGRKRGGWWAARGFRTWAERPHEKTNKKHEPSFSGKKTKNLRFRVFLATLASSFKQGEQRATHRALRAALRRLAQAQCRQAVDLVLWTAVNRNTKELSDHRVAAPRGA